MYLTNNVYLSPPHTVFIGRYLSRALDQYELAWRRAHKTDFVLYGFGVTIRPDQTIGR